MLRFVIEALATWRLASLLVNEDGPFEIFPRLRRFAGVRYDQHSAAYGENEVAKMLTCVWCCSLWVALFVSIFDTNIKAGLVERFMRALALSAAAVVVEEAVIRGKR